MSVETHHLIFRTKGDCEIIDITADVSSLLNKSNVSCGIVTIFVPGSTGGLTTIEYEPGLLKDFPAMFDRLIPQNITYAHDQTWHDGNGHGHVRASLLGPSITVPFVENKMLLGTWQQIIFVDFDNRHRRRDLVVQVIGE